jgi:hypothetical protein
VATGLVGDLRDGRPRRRWCEVRPHRALAVALRRRHHPAGPVGDGRELDVVVVGDQRDHEVRERGVVRVRDQLRDGGGGDVGGRERLLDQLGARPARPRHEANACRDRDGEGQKGEDCRGRPPEQAMPAGTRAAFPCHRGGPSIRRAKGNGRNRG